MEISFRKLADVKNVLKQMYNDQKGEYPQWDLYFNWRWNVWISNLAKDFSITKNDERVFTSMRAMAVMRKALDGQGFTRGGVSGNIFTHKDPDFDAVAQEISEVYSVSPAPTDGQKDRVHIRITVPNKR